MPGSGSPAASLVGRFLVAAPSMPDERFQKSVVFISLSDKMLFKSGSTEISGNAKNVLAKVATVVNDKPQMEVLVEGHTDDVPIRRDCVKDNWDLSAMRATTSSCVFSHMVHSPSWPGKSP